jgi:hypothetical protein
VNESFSFWCHISIYCITFLVSRSLSTVSGPSRLVNEPISYSPGIPERPSSFDLEALVFTLLHKKFEDAHAAKAGARQISTTECALLILRSVFCARRCMADLAAAGILFLYSRRILSPTFGPHVHIMCTAQSDNNATTLTTNGFFRWVKDVCTLEGKGRCNPTGVRTS